MGEKNIAEKFAFRAFPLILALLCMSKSPFAAGENWQPAVAGALLIAVFLIAVAYTIVYFLKLEAFKTILHDEIGQVIITGAIVGVIILGSQSLDDSIKKGVYGLSQPDEYCTQEPNQLYCESLAPGLQMPGEDIRAWALKVNKNGRQFMKEQIATTNKFISQVGHESSQSGMCNMLGIGFTIAGCTSWGVLRAPAGQLLNAQGFAAMDLQAENILIEAAVSIALPILLPLGVLLRSIYFTRQAGSALIALALSLYFVFPAFIVAGQAASDAFISENPDYAKDIGLKTTAYVCDPFDPDVRDLKNQMDSIVKGSPSLVEKMIFFTIGRFALMTALSLTAALAAARALGQALGTEINVMSIARLS